MKHIALKYHNLRKYGTDETFVIKIIDNKEQLADDFTKSLYLKLNFKYWGVEFVGGHVYWLQHLMNIPNSRKKGCTF